MTTSAWSAAVWGLTLARRPLLALTTVATSVLFIWLLNPQIGLINRLLALFGIAGPAWIKTSPWAFYSLVFMALWGVGGSMGMLVDGDCE